MKSHKKLLSLVTAVVFCLTFLAPVLVAPAPAMAASTYSVNRTQNVSAVYTGNSVPTLATAETGKLNNVQLQIDVANVSSLSANNELSIHLPADLEMLGAGSTSASALGSAVYYGVPRSTLANETAMDVYAISSLGVAQAAPAAATSASAGVFVFAPFSLDGASTANKLSAHGAGAFTAKAIGTTLIQIKMSSTFDGSAGGAGRILISFNNVIVKNAPANTDLSAIFQAPTGSGFTSGQTAVFGKYVSSATGTMAMMKSIKKISSAADQSIDTIMLQEAAANALVEGCYIKLKLPSGFKWVDQGTVVNEWGFAAGTGYLASTNATLKAGGVAGTTYYHYADTDQRTLMLYWAKGAYQAVGGVSNRTGIDSGKEGRILFNYMKIQVDDESVAKKGDVIVNISDDQNKVTVQDIVVATYADFTAEVKEGTAKEVVAGRDNVEVGDFIIKEGLAGSLLANRKVSLTLPTGAKWDTVRDGNTVTNVMTETCVSGTPAMYGASSVAGQSSIDSSGRVLSYNILTASTTASEYKFEKGKVRLSPDFTGDLVVEVGGTAGISGKAKVATVLAPATLTVEAAPNIVIGAQDQKVGTILIKESKKEVFATTKDASSYSIVQLTLPTPGTSKWVNKGTVTVSEGDAVIDKVIVDAADMKIYIKSTSTKPATIKIEGATVTPDRAVPEGDFQVSLKATAGLVYPENATNFDITNIAKATIAKVVTPAPTDTVATGANGAFTINSNVMMVNGQYRILDAAPYIKSGRTYVPIRAMGDALAATTNWDAATQTVTITKGDKTVALVIGNTVAKVNGADVTMEVAPEINNGRTMLPARYVAEGLGFQVQWNAATQQVVFGL